MFACFSGFSQNNFYYYFDEKVYLDPVPNNYTVEFIDTVDESIFTANNFVYTHIKNNIYEVSGDYFTILNASNGAYRMNQLYTYYGENAYIKNEISLRYNDNVTSVQIQALETQYNLINIINDPKLKVYKTMNPLVVANAIYETGLVKYCQPIFIADYVFFSIPSDEYFVNQFYLHNTGQIINGNAGTSDADIDALEAWDITLGNSAIEVAVIDEGVSPDHPDLPFSRLNIVQGSNFHDGSGTTSDEPYPHNNGNHGNAIAGIIAASINNGGVVGVSPETTIMPVKIDLSAEATLAQAIYFASHYNHPADVISISWGINSEFPQPTSAITDAIHDALLYNIPVVIAAGNTANHNSNDNGFVAYPANINEEDFIDYAYPGMDVIAVGASDRNDIQANYSPTDDEVDICAPSHSGYHINESNEGLNVWSIDIPGDDGYNFWHPIQGTNYFDYLNGTFLPDQTMGPNYKDYTGHMGGTSASAPQVAGVIALMKSLDVTTNCLTVPQINDIIKLSADREGGYNYHWSQDRPGHSKELGYGRLNAYNALLMTQEFITTGKDLFIKDYTYDIGIEPNFDPSPSPSLPNLSDFQYDNTSRLAINIFDSPDIWYRNQPDGIDNQTSEEIDYVQGQPAYIYVKVRNKGCESSNGVGQVTLYWSKSSTSQTFPGYWNGSMTDPLMGDEIDTKSITADLSSPFTPYQILEFEWYPEDPANYTQALGFSFLAIINHPEDQISVPTNQTANILQYVTLNNNIACKNIDFKDMDKPISDIGTQGSSLIVNNPYEQTETYDLSFRNSIPNEANSLLKEAEVTITLDDTLWAIWETGGFENENIIICDDVNRIVMIDNEQGASLNNLEFASNEAAYINTKINFLTKEVSNRERYDLFIIQKIAATQEIVGGSKIIVKKPPRPSFLAFAGENIEVSKNETITLNGEDINENATYNWYNEEGNLVFTGMDYLLNPEVTKTYKLEIIAESDGYKDYDEVEVAIKLPEITSLSPNPVNISTDILVNYKSENATSLYLVMIPLNGSFNDNFTLDSNQSQTTIPTHNYNVGLYFISLVADGQVVDQKTVVIY